MNAMGGFWGRLRIVLEMIKIEHTLFALPFAGVGAILAARGLPSWPTLGWILVAMVGARSAAMGFNRLVDRDVDARNPRTRNRALPAGLIGVPFVVGFVAAASALLVLAAWMLNPLALALSPVALGIVFLYSTTKRWTHWSHAWLGLALSVAPMGAWIAVRGSFGVPPFLLSAAVVFWLIGFDIIYALQDEAFDRESGLHSLPVRYGARGALRIARASHAAMVASLVGLGVVAGLGVWYGIGVVATAGLILAEHLLISPTDLRRLNAAFFQANVAVAMALLVGTSMDCWLGGWGTR